MAEITRNPLCWPNNVPRTAPQTRTWPQFYERSLSSSIGYVLAEINRLNQRRWDYKDAAVIISTNLRTRQDGLPLAGQSEPADCGAAVYFKLRFPRNGKWFERDCVLTCDRWCRLSLNLWAIAQDIEAQRARGRWGCTSVEQAFQGYLAIPEKCGGDAWWIILGIPSSANREQIEAAYKLKSKTAHPDCGGTHDAFTQLQTAFDQAMAQFR